MYGSRTLEIELIIALAKGLRWFSVISISIIRSFSIKEPGDLREREKYWVLWLQSLDLMGDVIFFMGIDWWRFKISWVRELRS